MKFRQINHLRTLIAEAKMSEFILELSKIYDLDTKLRDEATLLGHRWNTLESKKGEKSITEDEILVEGNEIAVAAIGLVQKLETIAAEKGILPLDVEVADQMDFLKRYTMEEVTEIWIQAHTGQHMINNFFQFMSKEGFKYQPTFKVLLRSPFWENQRRYKQLFFTVTGLREQFNGEGINMDIRFYQKAPKERLICFNYADGKRISFVSEYTQKPQKKTRSWEKGFIIQDINTEKKQNAFLEMRLDTFHHLWGKHEIHTLIFDFDDTLFETSYLQIEAWIRVTQQLLTEKLVPKDWLGENFFSLLEGEDIEALNKFVTRVFFQYQMAEEILPALFPHIPDEHQKKYHPIINERRYRIREKLTEEKAKPFDGVPELLSRLSNSYQLIIVSSTAESLIRTLLNKYHLKQYFSDIFGKFGPSSAWENIKSKAEKILKIASTVGVPLNRMVFWGDNNTDFKSAKQVNVTFVENNMIATKYSLETLLDLEPNESVYQITSLEDNQVQNLLNRLNNNLLMKKYKLPPDFTKA